MSKTYLGIDTAPDGKSCVVAMRKHKDGRIEILDYWELQPLPPGMWWRGPDGRIYPIPGNCAPVDYQLRSPHDSVCDADDYDPASCLGFISAANERDALAERLPPPLAPSDASPCAASSQRNADASFHGTRHRDGRKRREFSSRRDCPCVKSAALAGSRQAQYCGVSWMPISIFRKLPATSCITSKGSGR